MSKIGYARVSTISQSLDCQIETLKKSECGKIFKEKTTGTHTHRPQFKALMKFLREGDILYITRLDRLARSTRDLLNIKHELEEKKVGLVVVEQNMDTVTSTGKLLFGVLALFAEFDLDLKKENQREGIQMAKQKGTQLGRKKSCTEEQVEEIKKLRSEGKAIKELMKQYKISKASVYRILGPVTPILEL
jgi:DNA invertase Pin-like site-specific DNA recombinase